MNFKVRLFLSELLGKKVKKRSKINNDDFIADKTGNNYTTNNEGILIIQKYQ